MPKPEASARWQRRSSVLTEAGHKTRVSEVAAAWRPLESTLVAPRRAAAGVTLLKKAALPATAEMERTAVAVAVAAPQWGKVGARHCLVTAVG